MLLLVHGRGGRLPLMEFLAKRGALKEFDILLIEAPHADFVPEMKIPGFSWYIGPSQEGLDESRRRLNKLIDEICSAGYDSKKIFWCGFSQGCVMGLDIALRSDRVLGGVVGVSGFILRLEEYPTSFGGGAKETPILVTAGQRDEIVPAGAATEQFKKLQSLGVQVEIRSYDKPHSFDLKREIPEIELWLREKIRA